MTAPGADDFIVALQQRLAEADKNGASHCDVTAGDLHRQVGGYPGHDSRMATCCEAMRHAMRRNDRVLEAPGSGNGANLLIRYMLPGGPTKMPGADDFRAALQRRFIVAQKSGASHIDVLSGDLHREVGFYPSMEHRMPTCCAVMRAAVRDTDKVLQETPSGHGANLLIRYTLPRTSA